MTRALFPRSLNHSHLGEKELSHCDLCIAADLSIPSPFFSRQDESELRSLIPDNGTESNDEGSISVFNL